MAHVSTTDLRELAMQVSRLHDQYVDRGAPFTPIASALNGVLTAVDALVKQRREPGPPS